jgi:hypothetical protein
MDEEDAPQVDAAVDGAGPGAPLHPDPTADDDLIMLGTPVRAGGSSEPSEPTRAGNSAAAPQKKGAAIMAYANARSRPGRVAKSKPVDYNVKRNLDRLMASAMSTPLPGTDEENV